MLVELIGLPGSGKSTVVRALQPALRDVGLSATRANKILALPCADPAAPRYLKDNEARTMLYRQLAFRRAHPDQIEHLDQRLELDREAEFLFALTASSYVAWSEHRGAFEIALLDEGFAHRGVSAHIDATDEDFERYMHLIPVPELTLHLCPPPRMAFRRAIHRRAGRGKARMRVEAKLGDQQVFRRRHRLMEKGLKTLSEREVRVVDIDTAKSPEKCVAELLPILKDAALNGSGKEPLIR